jgi:hypothetical protein
MTSEERKQRNQVIAASIGGFILPFAGLLGAFVFYSRGDEKAAITVGVASFAGAIAYGALFALLA